VAASLTGITGLSAIAGEATGLGSAPVPARPPSVDALARSLRDTGLPHPVLVDAARAAIAAGDPSRARADAEAVARSMLRTVVNATGVLLHTNLGRAPLTSGEAPGPVRWANLELDLTSGRRGSRSDHAASLLARACGAEAAVVVNNGAAAVLLVLAAMAPGRRVLVSRGELVEVGGGFRIPDILATSGAELVEVGTTNRTRLADYRRACDDTTALVLRVHQSNFRIVGFTEQPTIAELATLGPPVVHDIGSGLLDAATPWLAGGPPAWLAGEPAARQSIAEGAALVTFSGDKLLGGPQAGVVAGRRELVARVAAHPLARALRAGGLVLAALQETALAYLRRDGDAIPFWRMAAVPVESLHDRAGEIATAVGLRAAAVGCDAVAGGGSLPGRTIPSAGVALDGDHAAALRSYDPPVVARVEDGRTLCDLRTVDPSDDVVVAAALAASVSAS
jgi:L-seryl-tRNA(Ser) seleniumtransferase